MSGEYWNGRVRGLKLGNTKAWLFRRSPSERGKNGETQYAICKQKLQAREKFVREGYSGASNHASGGHENAR